MDTNNTELTNSTTLEKKKEIINKTKKRNMIFNFVCLGLQILAITLILISLRVNNPANMILCVIALILEIAYITILIIKDRKNTASIKKLEDIK